MAYNTDKLAARLVDTHETPIRELQVARVNDHSVFTKLVTTLEDRINGLTRRLDNVEHHTPSQRTAYPYLCAKHGCLEPAKHMIHNISYCDDHLDLSGYKPAQSLNRTRKYIFEAADDNLQMFQSMILQKAAQVMRDISG